MNCNLGCAYESSIDYKGGSLEFRQTVPFGNRIMNFLRRLLPRAEKHWLLACDVLSLPIEFAVEGIDAVAVTANDQVRMELLDSFATQNGFPPGWARGMLEER